MEITSMSNAKVKTWMKYHQKKYRDQDACFLVEGEHLIEEALSVNCLQSLLMRKSKQNIFNFEGNVYTLDDEIMNRLSTNVSEVDYIGVCHKPQVNQQQYEKVLLLDDVQDPGNVGTIIRSAYSFGFDAIFVSKGCADVYNEKVIRSTQGAIFHMPIEQVQLVSKIAALKQDGYTVYATSLRDAKGLATFANKERLALVFGNEGRGVQEAIIAASDASIFIEMNAFESLNVAVAAGICMYHFRK